MWFISVPKTKNNNALLREADSFYSFVNGTNVLFFKNDWEIKQSKFIPNLIVSPETPLLSLLKYQTKIGFYKPEILDIFRICENLNEIPDYILYRINIDISPFLKTFDESPKLAYLDFQTAIINNGNFTEKNATYMW